MHNRLIEAFLLCICLQACGDVQKERPPEQLILVDHVSSSTQVYDKDFSGTSLQANTRLKASSLLVNYKDPLTFNVKAQFLSEESTLAVNAYTTSLTTNDGTRMVFSPNAQNGIEVYLYTRDYPLYHFCTIEYAVSKNGIIDLSVQLSYQDNRGPIIAIWNMYYDGKNKRKKNYTFLSAKSADCNSDGQVFIEHFGSGRLWGFEIQQTRIQQVMRSESYDL